MALTLADSVRNAACDGAVDTVDAGTTDAGGDLVIRDASNVELAIFVLDAPAFGNAGASVAGRADLAGMPKTVTAVAGGTADHAIIRDRDNTVRFSGLTVGTSGTDVVIDNTSINSGQDVTVNSGSFTMPAS